MALQTIGLIGLGIMGKPMARNLVKAGYPLIVANRSQGAVQELVAAGAQAAKTPREVAERSDVVITMLPDSPDVEAVVFGADGVRSGLRSGGSGTAKLFIDMSTIAPAVARKIAASLAELGVDALDAPVSGGEQGAIDGALSIMVGGPQAAFDAALPVFQAMGKNIVRIGESGAGQTTKACNQIAVAVTIEGVAEALALAEAAGVDPVKVRQALLGGLATSRILEVHGQRMIDHKFVPGFKAKLHRKDLQIAEQASEQFGLDLPATKLLLERMTELAAREPDIDHSGLFKLLDPAGSRQA